MITSRIGARAADDTPHRALEYGYYLTVVYAIMGPALGISVGFVGAAGLAALAAFCLARNGFRDLEIYRPIAAALACAAVFIVVQLLVHDESLMSPALRSMVTWILGLIIVHYLTVRRRFFHRFALVTLLIAVMSLPFLRFEFQRAGLEREVGFANPNDLAAWFGFCAVYFSVAGMEAKANWLRVALWTIALGSLFVVALTVSRGPLFAVVIAVLVAFRTLVKRGFLPILLLVLLCWGVYESGLFAQSAVLYRARFGEETGRLVVWPLIIERILDAPLAGVGVSDIGTMIPFRNVPITPHNSFLFMALASGIVPLILFGLYWTQIIRGALLASRSRSVDSAFQLPIVAYGFLITMQLSTPFMAPWMMASMAGAIALSAGLRRQSYVLRRISGYRFSARPGKWVKVGNLLRPSASRSRAAGI